MGGYILILNELKVNAEVQYYGKSFIVLSIDPPEISLVRSEGSGQGITVTFTELVCNPSFRPGKLMLRQIERDDEHFQAVLDALSEEKKSGVDWKLQMIKPLILFDRAKRGDLRATFQFSSHYREFLVGDETIDIDAGQTLGANFIEIFSS